MHHARVPLRYREMGEAAGNSAKTRADGFHRQLQKERGNGRPQHGDDRSRNPIGEGAAQQHRRHRGCRKQRRSPRERGSGVEKRFHPQPEFAGNFGQLQAEEIFDLRAGYQHRDAVGKTDHDRPRNKFHRRTHAGRTQDNEDGSRHDGTHVQAVNTVRGNNPGNHDDEGAGGPANLSLGSAEGGDQEAGYHGAVNAGLRSEARCNRKCHCQRQGNQPDRNSGDEVFKEFVQTVIAQTDYGLRQPTVVQVLENGGRHGNHYGSLGLCFRCRVRNEGADSMWSRGELASDFADFATFSRGEDKKPWAGRRRPHF
jgi:hypothetical protein